jgi:hypothetical protein
MTTSVTIQARTATMEPKREPMKPAPAAKAKAMKARPQPTGWRTITSVRPSAVLRAAVPKSILE